MENQSNNIPENIHLLKVNVIKYELNTSEAFLNAPQSIDGYEFGLDKEIAHDFDKGMARYRLHFYFKGMNVDREDVGLECSIGIEFNFKIDHFESYLQKEDGQDKIDLNLGASLMAIAYSTARGIILEKTQNTFFKGILIPVIDPKKFLLTEERE